MIRRRSIAWGLIVYGVLGVALVISGAVIGLGVAERIERLTVAADDTIEAAASSLRAAGDSFESIDASLESGQESAREAAALAASTGENLDDLASAMQISIFGAQPLLPLASSFATTADQAEALAGTLDEVAFSLDATRTDVGQIGDELTVLAEEIESLQADTQAAGGGPQLRFFVVLLLAWITVPAVGSILLGLAMLNRGASTAA